MIFRQKILVKGKELFFFYMRVENYIGVIFFNVGGLGGQFLVREFYGLVKRFIEISLNIEKGFFETFF